MEPQTKPQKTAAVASKLQLSMSAARRAAVPIVAVETPDPASTIAEVRQAFSGSKQTLGYVVWDVCNGFAGLDDKGVAAIGSILDGLDPLTAANPGEAVRMLAKAPKGTVVFMLSAHLFLENEVVRQGVWLLRDSYKRDQRMLVLLGPSFRLPADLQHDVVVLSEDLPDMDQLKALFDRIARDAIAAGAQVNITEDLRKRAADALIGLASFTAEQALAMSLNRNGFDLNEVWERKRRAIDATPGLQVWRGTESFEDIGGYDNVKNFMRRLVRGRSGPRAIVFIDEIEKAFGGASSDTSGVGQDQLGTILSWMQDKDAQGVIFLGPPGTCKSAMAKAAGNAVGIPTISLDLGGVKNSLVGSSEARLREALKVVDAMSQQRTLWVATCNSIATLPPELRRRFSAGTFFFDLPSAEERASIWAIYEKRFDLQDERPQDHDWTGAEIRNCCRNAWDLGITRVEAAKTIIPVAAQMASRLQQLRQDCSGRFISASYEGPYLANRARDEKASGRELTLE